ncbi:MAG: hypothetical protein PHW24_01455 [Candidatus Moranbacteria bacterium]|nr:hypothetical protein [Candidatus Moranbacteria bacterium]
MINIILTTLASLALAAIIISPFFWLKFLKEKSVMKYLSLSSALTLIFLFVYIYPVDDFLSNWTAKKSADLYYFYDDFNLYPILILVFLISISPLMFIKIIKNKFTWKSFLLGSFLSLVIFASIFTYWALVLLPQAFSHLHDHF